MQHFCLTEIHAYQAWRDRKLNNYPKTIEQLITPVKNPIKLTDIERNSLLQNCSKTNLVIYKTTHDVSNVKQSVLALASQLGLVNLDGNLCADHDKFSVIQDRGSVQAGYIPYTNKSLNWHTDGYYNSPEHRIRAFLMHCIHPAISGGENSYLDPEIAYILLRDENPNYIEALMDTAVMTIPANEEAGKQIRAAQTGPVFFIDKITQSLCMRYTARQQNIVWKNDATVKHALSYLHEVLQSNPYLYQYRLQAGEGVVCNNILHNRSEFEDSADNDKKRILYRARFYNRVTKLETEQDLKEVVN